MLITEYTGPFLSTTTPRMSNNGHDVVVVVEVVAAAAAVIVEFVAIVIEAVSGELMNDRC
jgi:hypothetical protein